jgi:hypothetical protein
MAGLTGNINLISSGIQYAIFLIGTAGTFFFIDRTGRRPLLIYGALSMATCFFVVGGMLGAHGTYLPDGLDHNLSVRVQVKGSPANTVIAFSYLMILAYSITLAPVAWGTSLSPPPISLSHTNNHSVRGRSMVPRDTRNWHGTRLHCKLALQFRDRLLHPPGLREHILETLYHLRYLVRRCSSPGVCLVPGDSGEDY